MIGYKRIKKGNSNNSHNSMESKLQTQDEQLHNHYLKELLLGNPHSEYLTIPDSWTHWGVIIVAIDSLADSPFRNDNIQRMHFILDNVIRDLIPDNNWFGAVSMDQNYVMTRGDGGGLDDAFRSFMNVQVRILQKTIKKKLYFTVSFAMSRSFNGLEGMGAAYAEVRDAMKYKLLTMLLAGLLKIAYDNEVHVKELLIHEDYLFEKLIVFHTREEIDNTSNLYIILLA